MCSEISYIYKLIVKWRMPFRQHWSNQGENLSFIHCSRGNKMYLCGRCVSMFMCSPHFLSLLTDIFISADNDCSCRKAKYLTKSNPISTHEVITKARIKRRSLVVLIFCTRWLLRVMSISEILRPSLSNYCAVVHSEEVIILWIRLSGRWFNNVFSFWTGANDIKQICPISPSTNFCLLMHTLPLTKRWGEIEGQHIRRLLERQVLQYVQMSYDADITRITRINMAIDKHFRWLISCDSHSENGTRTSMQ